MIKDDDKFVIPEFSYADEEVHMMLEGFSPFEKVKVTARSTDYYCINSDIKKTHGNVWESYAIFKADENGEIDVSKQIPIEGTYDVCDSMGLFYSMKIKRNRKFEVLHYDETVHVGKFYMVDFTIETERRFICNKSHKRYFYDDTIECFLIKEEGKLLGRYLTSKIKQKRPAIIVISGSEGRMEKAYAIASVLAMKGYSTFALCYFGLDGTSNKLSKIPLEYIENAIDFLKHEENVDQNKIAIYGCSKGAEMALLSASFMDEITAVAAIAPSIYIFEGLSKYFRLPSCHSSWTYRGKEVPYIKLSLDIELNYLSRCMSGNKERMTMMYKELTEKNVRRTAEARIRIEDINGPVLMLTSEKDTVWPSCDFAEEAKRIMNKKSFAHEFRVMDIPNAGHMITLPYQTYPKCSRLCGNSYKRNHANVQAWGEVVGFFERWKNT